MENGKNERKGIETDYRIKTAACLLTPPPDITGWSKLWDYCVNGYSPFEPAQGYADDCWLIAALSSVAWAAPVKLKAKTEIQIFNPSNTNDSKTYNFTAGNPYTENIPLNSGNVIFARSDPLGDSWPSLYEKAYAIWKSGKAVDNPDIGALGAGDGTSALKSVTGYPHTNPGGDIAAANVNFNATNPGLSSPPVNNLGKTLYPTVAWTTAKAGLPAGIYQNHSYSFFGFYAAGGMTYVILRNPYGSKFPVFNGGYNLNARWNGINLAGMPPGTFAMELGAFKNNFFALNYVMP
jgi:hypothetical protein